MNIAIIGTGNIGTALGRSWAKAGHHISLGVRDPENFKGKEMAGLPNVSVHTIYEATKRSDVILIAAIPPATAEIVSAMGNVEGKVIIDAMNSVRTKPEGYNSTFEALQDMAKGAEVVKCFNCTGYENMGNPVYPNDVHIDMFAAGFAECYDFGGNDKVALLEQFALVWINLAIMQGHGRNIAFKLLKK
jgi:8-hydroxy-5-deazaflavin:NADPH oxidoreductase